MAIAWQFRKTNWFACLVLVSRRNAKNVSYATWKPPAPPSANSSTTFPFDSRPTSVRPSPTSAEFPNEIRQRAMSVRARPEHLELPGAQSRQKLKSEEAAIKPVKTTVMTRGTVAGRGRRVRALDQLEWLGGMSTVCIISSSAKLEADEVLTDPPRGQSSFVRRQLRHWISTFPLRIPVAAHLAI